MKGWPLTIYYVGGFAVGQGVALLAQSGHRPIAWVILTIAGFACGFTSSSAWRCFTEGN